MESSQEGWEVNGSSKTVHDVPSSSLSTKSNCLAGVCRQRSGFLRQCLCDFQQVILGTKLSVLFPAIPLAIIAKHFNFAKMWMFASSLVGLALLAERVSFLTEQIACCTGPTVGGLINASCGNATELIIAVIALLGRKMDVVKYSLLGSILSNLLLVLGSSLFCGGLANLRKEQKYDVRQVRVNTLLLLLGLMCHTLPLMLQYAYSSATVITEPTLQVSRMSSVVMLLAYATFLFFQLKTHRQPTNEEDSAGLESEEAVIGYWSAFAWLAGLTALIALLSEYVVGAIEDTSKSWGLSATFISIIVLPIVGNATEHAGALMFAFRNKLDISLSVALGSATQISMFVIPLNVIVAWIVGIQMDLDFKLIGTGFLGLSVLITAFTLQDGTSHYMKGFVLVLSYIVIAACFFVLPTQPTQSSAQHIGPQSSSGRMSQASWSAVQSIKL